MKLQDMVLVIENIKGKETNMLMTLKEYKETYLFVSSLSREESAELLKGLFDTKFTEPGKGWAECYITANKSYYAKFCSGSDELQCFLLGKFNDDKNFQFDKKESSPECMQALEEYNLDINGGAKGFMFHYEADQMGIPDAVRFEQAEREKEQEKKSSAIASKTDGADTEDVAGNTPTGKNLFSDTASTGKKEQIPVAADDGKTEQIPTAADDKNKVQPRNYVIDLHHQETGGEKTRYKWNVDAIRTLKRGGEAEGRNATPEEQGILAKYAGWGGTSQAFDEKSEGWQKEYVELKTLLTPEEYREARATVTTAFYTPPVVAAAVGEALVQFGFQGGNVLEPSMGTGHFFGTMPEQLKGSRLFGVEKDSISGRIARLLYPQADIQVKGFEETDFTDNFFDVVLGNVPFGDFKVYDRKYNAENFKIHDYFVAKSIDKVRPGGIVAVITTKGTMDKKNNSVRKYLAERAELVGAVRLPNSAFKAEAGTEVTSDILFFQKRERKIAAEPDWVHL